MDQFYRKPAIPFGALRVFIFLVVWIIALATVEFFGLRWMEDVFPDIDQRSIPFQSVARGFSLVISLVIVYLFRKLIDRRPLFNQWFSITQRKIDLFTGFGAGVVMIALGALVLHLLGYIQFSPGNLSGIELFQYIVFFFIVSLLEELIFRGYVLDNLLTDMHPFFALFISSALFMALHLLNPNVEPLPIVNLFLAGFLLGVSFIYTKNLWFPIGLHWSWNLFQGPVFGFEVSGIEFKSLLNQTMLADNIWTGGLFGFEGSVLATIIILLGTLTILFSFKAITKHENN